MNLFFMVLSVVLSITGLMIWRFQMVEIVVGYDTGNVIEKKDLGDWVGFNLFLMGMIIFIQSSISLFLPQLQSGYLIAGFFISTALLSLRTVLGFKKCETVR